MGPGGNMWGRKGGWGERFSREVWREHEGGGNEGADTD